MQTEYTGTEYFKAPKHFKTVRLNHEQIIQRGVNNGFGSVTARCHGMSQNGFDHVVVRNFITGDPRVSPITDPQGDVYLSYLAVSASERYERPISFPMLPGLLEIYEQHGLIPSVKEMLDRIIIVNPQFKNNEIKGHPFTDPVVLALQQFNHLGPGIFSATFPTVDTIKSARSLGLEIIQSADLINANKAHLREYSKRYGISMIFGNVIRKTDDIYKTLEDLQRRNSGKVWLKIPFASGGDGVKSYQGIMSEQRLLQAIKEFRFLLKRAFEVAEFENTGISHLWPEDSLTPFGGLVLEQDVFDAYGKEFDITICSNALEIGFDGTVTDLGDFKQITVDGAYMGSRPIQLSEEAKLLVDANNIGTAKYVTNELNHYGIIGTDYALVVHRPTGRTEAALELEINQRDPISWDAQQAALKVFRRYGKVGSFINTNLVFPENITTIDQLKRFTSLNGHSFLDGKIESGMVIPIAVRSIFTQINGAVEPIFESPVAKCIIVAENSDHCSQIRSMLAENGVK
ncbi:hypothetical protein A2954_03995 [Candidatus Roizmanbacteria bacterium RIFCSPLOWO2_01_FULL_37_12]|uniref:ATP-grasp domain-containing protein n=1 Tax=Candidatus Roizmanbacteria bacterium RIFCSPLOWO2_01_FULL_37_12 TaxID=1802056 RepID=A0A1F7IES5_9BACT|nr:MAG: hypothetical protein A3D76_03160 [Candidatus Roizmanbacteria bacterium RIFCSPHIGHO2_02_FULL_37_9b]OGK41845.1 MAG: hypothetical protein A2954_03995 [Candidatus Roizmanbacteria bacterium RIFCSPLOWO2_01_FULL_37_12]